MSGEPRFVTEESGGGGTNIVDALSDPTTLAEDTREAVVEGGGLYGYVTRGAVAADRVWVEEYGPGASSTAISADRIVATRSALAASETTDFLYLSESGREGWWAPYTGDAAAEVQRDPLQGMAVAFASDPLGADGAWYRVVENAHELIASRWGFTCDRDVDEDNDDPATNVRVEGTDNTPVIDAIIAYCREARIKYAPGSSQIAKIHTYRVLLNRGRDDTGFARLSGESIVSPDKQIVFDGVVCGSVVLCSPSADYPITFMNHSQGAQFGCENLHFWGGGVRLVGGSQGKGIVMRALRFVDTSASGILALDRQEYEPGYTGPAKVNITQFAFDDLEATGGGPLIDWRATTFAAGKITNARTNSMRGPSIVVSGTALPDGAGVFKTAGGIVFEDFDFTGIDEANYADSAFIHLNPPPGRTVTGLTFRNVRFGSEDTNQFGKLHQPPRQLVLFGPAESIDTSAKVTRVVFENARWNAAHVGSNANGDPFLADGTTPNPDHAPVEAGIRINCEYDNLSVTGGERDEFTTAFIDDSSGVPTTGNKLDMTPTNTWAGRTFAPSALGWDVRSPLRDGRITIRPSAAFASPGDAVLTTTAQSGYLIRRGDLVEIALSLDFDTNAYTTTASGTVFQITFDLLDSDGVVIGSMPTPDPAMLDAAQMMSVPSWTGFDIGSTSRTLSAQAIGSSIQLFATRDANGVDSISAGEVGPSDSFSLDVTGHYWATP